MSANASTPARQLTPLAMFLREYYRNALNVALLFVIPPMLILSFGDAVSRLADVLQQTLTRPMGLSMGALWSAAFLTAITGFFMMVGARSADRRLVRAGYDAMAVVTWRFAAIAVLGLFATLVSYAVLLTQLTPTDYFQSFATMYLAALIYGALGILVGSAVTGELEGSFALLFFFVMDAFIGSPLFGATSDAFALLPTYFPTKILLAITAEQPHDAAHWLYAGAYLVVVAALAGFAFHRVARVRS